MSEKDLWEDIKTGIVNAAEVIGDAGKDIYTKSKLSVDEIKAKRELRDAYAELGKFVYENRDSEECCSEQLETIIEKVTVKFEKYKDIASQKEENAKDKVCPECGKKNEKEAAFCSGCGFGF